MQNFIKISFAVKPLTHNRVYTRIYTADVIAIADFCCCYYNYNLLDYKIKLIISDFMPEVVEHDYSEAVLATR